MDNPKSIVPESDSSQIRAHPVAPSCKGHEAHASDIGCICIRLSSSLCCGLASHVRGEAVTQSFRTRLSLLSHQLRISTLLSISPADISSSFLLFSRFQTSPQHTASTYTLSSLPCLHSCILLHGAALTYISLVTLTYLFQVKPCRLLLHRLPKREIFHGMTDIKS